jgi:HSP20 family protein
MANITVNRSGGEGGALARGEAWDPFRAMRELMHWDPFRTGVGGSLFQREAVFVPDFEIKETKDAFEFRADVPGVEPKDLDVKLSNNRLSVTGKREAEKTDKGDTYYAYERSYGSFARTFTVPEGINADAISTDLKDGVLKIVVPKKPEAKPREVKVKSG